MTKKNNFKQLFLLMSAAGIVSVSGNAMASAFQLYEQDAASIGNYHAGIAASADDASTAWYNPAGMVRIKNQQIIFGGDGIMTDFLFRGTVGVNTLTTPLHTPFGPQPTTAQGGKFGFAPFLHYVAPITPCVAFGMSVDVPFGLKTDYGNANFARYAATLTSLTVVDYTPSLAVALSDKFSIGVGADIQHLSAEFDNIDTFGVPGFVGPLDTVSHNGASDVGYGYRIGGLYQPTQETRVGVNYRSKVTHHPTGTSHFYGPLATRAAGGPMYTNQFKSNATLPAVTNLSLFQVINSAWDVMGSVTYTQWSSFKNLTLQNVTGIQNGVASSTIIVNVAEHYRNSWNYAVGANYHPCNNWILRTGLGFDQTPTNNNYRNLQLPDSDRIALALGGHYQIIKAVGIDLGYTHIFGMNTRINNVSQKFGDEVVTTNGSIKASADVYGVQVKWDII